MRDDVGVTDADEEKRDGAAAEPAREVLSSLPSTRPQRPSARRQAARGPRQGRAASDSPPTTAPGAGSPANAASAPAASGRPSAAAEPTGPTAKTRAQRTTQRRGRTAAGQTRAQGKSRAGTAARGARSRPSAPRSPAQGYEADTTGSVRPPTGAEVLGSAVEAASDLAHAGLRTTERLLRGALSKLPRL